jgi:ABC-2 type transport system permease protein
MDKILVIFKREYMERVRTRWFIISTLMVPLLMVASTILPALLIRNTQASGSMRNIAILDATGTDLGKRVAAGLTADSASASDSVASVPQVRVVAAADLSDAVATATAEVVGAKPSLVGFLVLNDSTLSSGVASYSGRNASAVADLDLLHTVLRQSVMMVRLQREGVRPDVMRQLSDFSVNLQAERLTEQGHGGSATSGLLIGYAIAMLLYFSIILHGQNVMRGVLEEKLTRVAEVVLSSVKPDALLAGKVLGVGAVGLTQQVAWFGLSIYLVDFLAPFLGTTHGAHSFANRAPQGTPATSADAMHMLTTAVSGPTMALVLGFFLAGFILYAGLFASIGAMVSSEQEAGQAAFPVMFLLIITVVCVSPVAVNPNGRIAVVLSWIPFSSPIIMPMRMVLNPVPWPMVAGSLAVAFAGCVATVWCAARIHRVGMLMYGKRPGLGELVRWLRYA